MHTVSIFDAKTHLSQLVSELVNGLQSEIVISRHGKPVVRMEAVRSKEVAHRIGVAKGRFTVPDDIDVANPDIARLFAAEGKAPYAPAS